MLRLSKNNNPQHLVNRIQSGLRNYYYRLEDGSKYCEDAALNERMHGASILFLNGNIDELRAEMAQIFPILEEKHDANILCSQLIPMFIYVYHGHNDALIFEKKDFLIRRSNEIMLNIRRCGKVARSVIRNLYEPVLKYLSL